MLTNEYDEKLSKRLKQSFFMTQMCLMSNFVELPYLCNLLVTIALFWINISIFFIADPLQPQILNQCIRLVLVPYMAQRVNITVNVFKIVLVIQGILFIISFIVHLRSTFMNGFLTKMSALLAGINYTISVPNLHLLITSFQDILNPYNQDDLEINLLLCITLFIVTLIVGAITAFRIRFLRKKSLFWSVDNDKQFYSYCLNAIRVLIIVVDGRTTSFLIISLFAELILRQNLQGYFPRQTKKLQTLTSNLTISVHIGLLVRDFTNSALGTQILGFLIAISFINSFLSTYSILNEERHFPLCDSQIYEYYDFYFHFLQQKIKGNSKAKLSVKQDSQNDRIISVHTLNCKDKNCKLKNVKLSEQTYCEDLQNLCNEMMVVKSQESVKNQIIYELWKFQTGNKYNFRMQNKQMSLKYECVIFNALNLSRLNQTSDSINEENIKSLKSLFYDKLQNCLMSFSLFYEQIAKTQPKINTLLGVGSQIKTRTNELKNMYSQLLKHSVINFKTAQVYVQFENFFLKESNVNQESIDRLRKIQKSKEAEHIEEIYLPTFTSYSDTGLIENINTECLSFFRLTRFQMKSKNIASLIYPPIKSLNQVKQKLRNNKKQKLYTFFLRGDQVVYGSIIIKQKYIENKKFDVVTIQKSPYSDFKNVIMISKETFEIHTLQKQETFIRPNLNYQNHLLLKWRYLYNTYFFSKIQKLISQKISKIRVEQFENSLFVMSIEQSIHPDFYIINLKFIKDMEKTRNRLSSFMINKNQHDVLNINRQGKFSFFYDFQDKGDSFCLYGIDNEQLKYNATLSKTKSLGKLEKDINNLLITNTLLLENRFSHGIKCYRLHEGELYNIDLEDKQKYVEQFEQQILNKDNHSNSQSSESDLYLITGIFFTLIVLAGMSIFYNSTAASSHTEVTFFYSNTLKIQQLRLQMNRLVSITRDMEVNRYSQFPGFDWKKDLLKTYAKLKELRTQGLLFDSKQIIVKYRGINYTGTLNEIIDVMISHIYQMTLGTFNQTQIQMFHDSYIGDVNQRIIQEKDNTVLQINKIAENFSKIQRILIIIGVISIFLFYFLLGYLIIVLNNAAKKKLNALMLMSDTQARMNQTMADKLKYAVDMIKKNFDLDLKTIIGPPETHKQRKKPKQIVLGVQKTVSINVLMLIGFSLHILLYLKFTGQMSIVMESIKAFQLQGQALIETYSTFTEVTNEIDHFAKYDVNDTIVLRKEMNYLTSNRNVFSFDADTNKFIDLFFYENSCSYLQSMNIFANQSVTCQYSLPNYIVNNPFQLGMVAYFSRAHYNIFDNITETFGCTGLYAGPFIEIFDKLCQKIRNYGLRFIDEGYQKLIVHNLIYTVMELLYLTVTIFVIYTLKKMNKQITDLLKFLNYNNGVNKDKDAKNEDNKIKRLNSTKSASKKSLGDQKNEVASQNFQKQNTEQLSNSQIQ